MNLVDQKRKKYEICGSKNVKNMKFVDQKNVKNMNLVDQKHKKYEICGSKNVKNMKFVDQKT
jgi:hypothetical protein